MSRIDDVMEADETAEPTGKASNGDRMSSIMEDDYEVPEKNPAEPEETKIEDEQIPSSEKPKEKEVKEKKEEKDDDKEEKKKEVKKEEEKKPEIEKKKVKYKVDGQEVEEDVTEQDLINNYSGQKAIQKRFNEIDYAKKEIIKKEQHLASELNWVKQEMQDVRSSFSGVIDDFVKTGSVKQNPMEGVYNLIDKMGLDAKEFDKLLFSHYIPEVAKFLDMEEDGREAFMLKKENEWLKKGRDKIESEKKQNAEQRRKLEEENSLKRQSGVSEEQFLELKNELESKFDLKDLKTEQIIQWAKEKPAYDRAESIAEKVPGTNIVKVAKIILEFPDTTDEWMLEQLGYNKILEKKAVEDLKGKIPPKPKAKTSSEDTAEDDELFKQFRRR